MANGAVQTIEAQARAHIAYPLCQPNQLFRNLGSEGGLFEETTETAGAVFDLSEVSRGAAFGDLDNDGDVDILVVNNSGPARVLLNQAGNKHAWIGLRLVDDKSGRDMLGARVAVHRAGRPTLWRHVRTAAGYCSANDPRILVGLGDVADVTRVCVYWPDGHGEDGHGEDGHGEQWTDLPVNGYTTLRRGSGTRMDDQ